jgi:hypothetical protein
MANAGFEEAQADFNAQNLRPFVGQVRRFGAWGPAYEVVEVLSSGAVIIAVIETGERLEYAISALLEDPLAETVP